MIEVASKVAHLRNIGLRISRRRRRAAHDAFKKATISRAEGGRTAYACSAAAVMYSACIAGSILVHSQPASYL
jgi:hypothetical protein